MEIVRDFPEDRFVVTASAKGQVKRTSLSEYANIRTGGIRAAGVSKKDELVDVRITDGSDHILLATREGQAIRFEEGEVRSMGRTASGVKGIDLDADDRVIAMIVPRREATFLAITEQGFAKAVQLDDLRVQGRGGKGVSLLTGKARDRGELVGFIDVVPDDIMVALTGAGELVPFSSSGPLSSRAGSVPPDMKLGDRTVTAVARAPIWQGRMSGDEEQMELLA